MESIRDLLRLLFPLALLAYLGLYVFALVMGVFGPTELPAFTIGAGVAVLILVLDGIAARRHGDAVASPTSAQARAARTARERRGW